VPVLYTVIKNKIKGGDLKVCATVYWFCSENLNCLGKISKEKVGAEV
jgi:hypothetical protein